MKFQNPSLNFFLNGRKDGRTNEGTHKPKPICSPLFQSWGHKNFHLKIVISVSHENDCILYKL